MRNTLICTVGTSLLLGIPKLDKSEPLHQVFNQIKNTKQKNEEKWKPLSLELLKLENTERKCGAEINSITSIWNEELLDQREYLLFLVSETDDGKSTGEILKQYYSHSRNPLKFERVEFKVLQGLRDDDVQAFQQQGLKNLVIEISDLARKFSADTIAINATGGYKAQISFAGMIGQALGIPVYYLFEKFSKVIKLPPQPVALDLSLWLENYSPMALK